jgi:hypothetical protein
MDDMPSYLAICKLSIISEPITESPKYTHDASPIADSLIETRDISHMPLYYVPNLINRITVEGVINSNSARKVLEEKMLKKVTFTEKSIKVLEKVFEHLRMRLQYEKGWKENLKVSLLQSSLRGFCRMCCCDEDLNCVEINGFRHSYTDFLTDRKFFAKVYRFYNNILGDCHINIRHQKENSVRAIKCLTGEIIGCHVGDYLVVSISPRRY